MGTLPKPLPSSRVGLSTYSEDAISDVLPSTEISRDVKFDEPSYSILSRKSGQTENSYSSSSSDDEGLRHTKEENSAKGNAEETNPTRTMTSSLDWSKFMSTGPITRSKKGNLVTEPRMLGRSNNSRGSDVPNEDAHAAYEDIVEPASYDEAQVGPNASLWNDAIEAELRALEENETFRLMELPKGRKAIKTRWVFKVKRHADDSVERFKARLVAKGFTQKEGIDYNETFAPVVKNTTLRLMLNLAVQKNWEITQVDVSSAFLNGKIEEELYIEIPDGYNTLG